MAVFSYAHLLPTLCTTMISFVQKPGQVGKDLIKVKGADYLKAWQHWQSGESRIADGCRLSSLAHRSQYKAGQVGQLAQPLQSGARRQVAARGQEEKPQRGKAGDEELQFGHRTGKHAPQRHKVSAQIERHSGRMKGVIGAGRKRKICHSSSSRRNKVDFQRRSVAAAHHCAAVEASSGQAVRPVVEQSGQAVCVGGDQRWEGEQRAESAVSPQVFGVKVIDNHHKRFQTRESGGAESGGQFGGQLSGGHLVESGADGLNWKEFIIGLLKFVDYLLTMSSSAQD
ncbi:hypothetical protein TYRP_008513 [Tyrophagus putrescentiae]|nr:hypothetical protein TYRP_008513 [Tyrophagus putrescentiae]